MHCGDPFSVSLFVFVSLFRSKRIKLVHFAFQIVDLSLNILSIV